MVERANTALNTIFLVHGQRDSFNCHLWKIASFWTQWELRVSGSGFSLRTPPRQDESWRGPVSGEKARHNFRGGATWNIPKCLMPTTCIDDNEGADIEGGEREGGRKRGVGAVGPIPSGQTDLHILIPMTNFSNSKILGHWCLVQ